MHAHSNEDVNALKHGMLSLAINVPVHGQKWSISCAQGTQRFRKNMGCSIIWGADQTIVVNTNYLIPYMYTIEICCTILVHYAHNTLQTDYNAKSTSYLCLSTLIQGQPITWHLLTGEQNQQRFNFHDPHSTKSYDVKDFNIRY